MLKTAYRIGVQMALEEAGLLKVGQGFADTMKNKAYQRQSYEQIKPMTGPARPPATAPAVKPPSNLTLPSPSMKPPTAPSIPKPPQSQLGMRKSNIMSQRQRLKSLS